MSKVDSDAWTGTNPDRAAPQEISPEAHRKIARLLFACGGLGLFLLGYEFATFERWSELMVPASLALYGFSAGAHEWRLATA